MQAVADFMSLSDAAKQFPGRPHISTLIRWSRKGVRDVKLETVVVGHRRFVTQEAIDEFIRKLNQTDADRLEAEGC